MRFPLATIGFLITSFIFFCFWVWSSFFIDIGVDAFTPLATDLGEDRFTDLLTLLPFAFGIISCIFFVVGILIVYFVDALAEEPEYYYRR